jgi:hypothetical protein
MSPSNRRRAKVAAVVFAGVAALSAAGSVAPAGATTVKKAATPVITIDGSGTYSIGGDGAAGVSGTAELFRHNERKGKTVSVVASLAAADGTLPDPGVCEDATATLNVVKAGANNMKLVADGQVCGQFVQAPYVVTQVFTGTYTVVAGSRCVRGTDGFYEVRLGNDGTAHVFAIDT